MTCLVYSLRRQVFVTVQVFSTFLKCLPDVCNIKSVDIFCRYLWKKTLLILNFDNTSELFVFENMSFAGSTHVIHF